MSSSSTSLPTQAITLALLSAVSLFVGYRLGKRSHLQANRRGKSETPSIGKKGKGVRDNEETEDDDDEEDIADGDLSTVKAGLLEPCKMVLVVRTDLKMTQGKVAAQCGHATLACYKALMKENPKLVQHWERIGQAKIALRANSEDQLLELEAIAKSLNLCARSIRDAGHTQVDPGTRTVLGIGPAPVSLINQVTGELRLL